MILSRKEREVSIPRSQHLLNRGQTERENTRSALGRSQHLLNRGQTRQVILRYTLPEEGSQHLLNRGQTSSLLQLHSYENRKVGHNTFLIEVKPV